MTTKRPRRLRQTAALRKLFSETELSAGHLILPLFVEEGLDEPTPIESMPSVQRHSLKSLVAEAQEAHALGVPAVLLFGIPKRKDELASEAYDPTGVVQEAIKSIKNAIPEIAVVTDVCLCEYMSHGHCGIVENEKVLNDPSIELLAKTAVSHAEAGADMVAPSDMMDGRIGTIRRALDAQGFTDTPLMSYAVKYASAFYGPFREAAGSAPSFGDRKTYQMDPANAREAVREAKLDIEEEADIIMVKPALPYLDVIQKVRTLSDLPLAAYQVSGEYAMLKAAAEKDWLHEKSCVLESLLCIKRAGADVIVTYYAKEAARWLKQS
jgi:porphobilinogen synthase